MENADTITKPVEKERKSIKIWSENLQRYYYKSKDPNYYNDYFHKTKRPMTCGFCGKNITCQMYCHLKSKTQKKSHLCKVHEVNNKKTKDEKNLEDLKFYFR